MTDLATWLLQQIAEDEAVALQADGHESRAYWHEAVATRALRHQTVQHYTRWNPKRALDECEAKRLRVVWAQANWRPGDNVADGLLRWEALPYADRPGYRQEWAP